MESYNFIISIKAHCACDQTKVNAYNLSIDGIGQSANAATDGFPQSTAVASSVDGTSSSDQLGQITPTNFVLSGDDIVSLTPETSHRY